MDDRDIDLIERHSNSNPLLRTLFQRHKELDKKLQKLAKKPFLTAGEQREVTELKRQKLAGKDKLMRILEKYR